MEDKMPRTSVSKPGKLSEGEIEANIKAILDYTEVEETLAKLGVSKAEIFRELSAKKFILPKKAEDEIGYAKRYIKFQVVEILASKYSNKITEDKSEEVKRRVKELSGDNATNMERGDAAAIIAMIEAEGYLFSKDGKTGKKLTPKQIEIITRKLREGMTSIDELLEEIELEDDELELDEVKEKKAEEEIENPEIQEKNDKLDSDLEQGKNNEPDEQDIDEMDIDSNSEVGEEEKNAVQNKTLTMEDYNFRKATETEKSNVLELNQQSADNYRNITFYVAPENVTLEEVAKRIMEFEKNNEEGERVVVSYNGIIIDPQEFSSPEQIVEEVKSVSNKNAELPNTPIVNKDKIKNHIKGITDDTIQDNKKVAGLTPTMDSMRIDAEREDVIKVQEEQDVDIQKSEDDEHPFPGLPEER